MLRSAKHFESFTIGATDGNIGKVKDLYFDDEAWVVRYLVVNTGSWLGGREVLISPYAIGEADETNQVLPVSITKEQVKNSPGIDTDKPIARQYERTYLGYYGYPYYWGGTGLWGEGAYPGTMLGSGAADYPGNLGYLRSPSSDDKLGSGDPHLRSVAAVKGYHVHATDGEIGHVDGIIVDDSTWSIRYLVINTSNWWVGHQVVVSPEWIESISWAQTRFTTDLTRQAIKDAPPYQGDAALERSDELRLYKHHGRGAYWLNLRDRAAA
jgi:uncharacterized protein YrrD